MRLLFLLWVSVLNIAVIAARRPSLLADDSNAKYPDHLCRQNFCVRRAAYGVSKFSKNLIKEIAKHDRNNLIVSPFGVALSMAMSAAGANTATEVALSRALDLAPREIDRRVAFQTIIDRMNGRSPMELHVANRLFVSSILTLKPKFLASGKRAFRSSVRSVNFDRAAETSNGINEFCNRTTHGCIEELLNADDLDGDLGLVVENDVYFKGEWLKKFEARNTKVSAFHFENGTTTLMPIMSARHVVRFGEYPEAKATFVELPFLSRNRSSDMSLFILLPNDTNGLAHLEKNFNRINVHALRKRGNYRVVDIELPKFTFGSVPQLNDPLTRINLGNVLDPQEADFTGIAKNARFFVDRVVQKAFIEIDEKGAEAAAATGRAVRQAATETISRHQTTRKATGPVSIEVLKSNGEVNLYEVLELGPWIWERSIDHKGSEADATAVKHATRFIANRSFYVIIATMTNEPFQLYTARFTG